MKFIPVESFQDVLRASICWNNCNSENGCKDCDCGLSIRQIFELLDTYSNDSDCYLFDASKYLPKERKC